MHLIDRNKHRFNSGEADTSKIYIREGNLHVKTIASKTDILKIQDLRYRVFVQELGWVQQNSRMLETDDYDEKAIHFGVFDSRNNIKASLRIITSENCFMLDKVFPFLVSDASNICKRPDTVEVSRLCVATEARSETFSNNFGMYTPSMLLYKGVYQWCLKNRKHYLYLVVEQKIFRMLCAKGFPCYLVREPTIMPDGVVAVAAMLNWRVFEEKNLTRRPNLVEWFNHCRLYHRFRQYFDVADKEAVVTKEKKAAFRKKSGL